MPERKLIVCNIAVFFEDKAPAAYPWLLDKLGRGDEARTIQAKYEAEKSTGPLLLPEMAKLFEGISVRQLEIVCRQYCWEYGRIEVVGVFRRLRERGHRCMLETSLPEEMCTEFSNLTFMPMSHGIFAASNVITTDVFEIHIADREDRKETVLGWVELELKHGNLQGWDDVIVIGQSLTDIPLGKAVQEKGGRFIAFKPQDGDIMKAATQSYKDWHLTRMFEKEGLI